MPTDLQIKALDRLVKNGGNISKAMREANYSSATAKTPKKLTESKGFKDLCEKMGLTDEFLTSALVEDIKLKPQNRKPELELGFKVKGLLNDENKIDPNLTINILNYDGNNDPSPLHATPIPTPLLTEQKEIQDSNHSPKGWQVKDGIKRTDTQGV